MNKTTKAQMADCMNDLTFLEQFASNYRWDSATAKRRFRNIKQINKGMREDHRLALTLGGVIDRSLDDAEGLQASDYEAYQIFEKDDLVFKLIDLENIKTSRVGHVPQRGIMSPAYIRLSPTSNIVVPKYYYWMFYAVYLNNVFNGMGGGVRQNLTPTDLLEFPIPLTPKDTQRKIADFLDRETARIDLLIEKKEQMASMLKAKYLSYVGLQFKALTSEHWRLRHLCKVKNGAGFPEELQGESGNEIPFFKVKHLIINGLDQRISLSGDTISRETAASLRATIFPAGTIIFAKIGAALMLARFSMLGVEGCIDNNCAAIIPNKSVKPDYLLLALERSDMELMVHPGAVPSLNTEYFINQSIPLPTLEQQDDFVSDVRKHKNQVFSLIGKLNKTLNLLREYKAALITAAVTGQIDVESASKSGTNEHHLDRLQKESEA